MMRPHHTKILSIVSSLLTFIAQFNTASVIEHKSQDSVGRETNPRRILHQPLFPVDTSPPPPPPSTPAAPFFPAPDQYQPPPGNGTEVSNPAANHKQQKNSRTKVFATGISVAIVILGMISGLAFYLYKHKREHFDESQKQVRGNSRGINEEESISSTFLYIGTIEPSGQRMVPEIDHNRGSNGLPLKKMYDRHRPSPELQPLPPLSKPFLPTNSPSALSSSDEDSCQETTFYTPKGSIISNEEGSNTPPSRNNSIRMNLTSQKSDLFSLSPESNPPYAATRPQFSSPPPPPDFARLQLIANQSHEMSRASVPPPPPPPPPPVLSTASKGSIPAKKQPATAIPKAMNPHLSSPTLQEAPYKNEDMGMINSSKRDNGDEVDESRPKLKALHWDKVRATSDRATVWDKFTSSSFRLNEDAMESLFGCEPSNSVPKEVKRKSVMPPVESENGVLDPKKSQNIAILLRALNVTIDEVSEALLDGNLEELGPELLETLMKMAPTKEEEIKLRDYSGDASRLGSAERFLKAILDIPFAFKRVDAMLYRANFDTEINYLTMSFLTLEEASKELKNSKLFLKLLEAVLRTGNRMNDGTNRGDARAFKLDTLLKLADVKGTDGKTTLLHFVVQEIIRSEGVDSESTSEDYAHISYSGVKDEEFRKQGLHVVAGLSRELGNVKKAASMDTDVLSSYVSKLELGLEKVRLVLQYETPDMQGKIFESLKDFLQAAEESIDVIKSQEQRALSSVKEVTEYFHGDAAQEEAHPFRIFVIVRDFLVTLDNVCKEVRKIQDRSMVTGTGRSFRAPETASFAT